MPRGRKTETIQINYSPDGGLDFKGLMRALAKTEDLFKDRGYSEVGRLILSDWFNARPDLQQLKDLAEAESIETG